MKSTTIWYKFAAAALAAATVFSVSALSLADQPDGNVQDNVPDRPNQQVCSHSHGFDAVHCQARVVVDPQGKAKSSALPSGYGPAQLRGAYGLGNGIVNKKQVIAIVDAYDHPNILSDLNTYSRTFSLPQMTNCLVSSATSTSPCFQKVDQRGGIKYPPVNSGWALEIALDVETAHAICQNCSILLVEGDSNSFANLLAAEDRAFIMGATEVSNSWGGSEFASETSFDSHFNHQGVAITVSSGDSGFGPEYPAASRFVTSVGGTTLNLSGNNYLSESAWSGAGSGCSSFETKPGFQHDANCGNRTIADVSADANPSTGAAVYDSVRLQGRSGWFQVGGTSLSSPLIAGVYALAGGVASGYGNALPYAANGNGLHDVISGSNGSCGGLYLCTAVSGYDGPTGLGSPNGTAAFRSF